MSGRIPDDIIDQVRARTSIVDVVGQYVKLTRRGASFLGLCPFHNEKTPSFNVSAERGFYHCFGCGASGNAISFLMNHDGLSFRESIEQLAGRAGISLPADDDDDRSADQARRERERYFHATDFAQSLYERALWAPEGEVARAYLRSREIGDETARAFGLGFAAEGWRGLMDAAARKGIPAAVLLEAGLTKENDRGDGTYDRFRNRIMFPIHGLSKQILAFSGRALSNDDPAKYLNSPETRYYRKGRELFGLHLASREVSKRERAILVEGNFDVVSMHARGFTETVAALGTALTVDQGRLLRRFTDRVVLLYDADRAGRAAAEKAFDVLMSVDMPDVRVVQLPDGMDPDDFARRQGAERLKDLLERARPMLDVLLDRAFEGLGSEVGDRAQAARAVAALLARVPDPLVRSPALEEASRRLDMRSRDLAAAVTRAMKEGGDKDRNVTPSVTAEAAEGSAAPAPRPAPRPPLTSDVRELWRLVCVRPPLLQRVYREQLDGLLEPADVQTFFDALAGAWVSGHTEDPMAWAEKHAPDGLLSQLQRAAAGAVEMESSSVEGIFDELTAGMKTRWVRRELARLSDQIRRAEAVSGGTDDAVDGLLARQAELLDYLRSLEPVVQ
jgi:DNA primase